MSAVTPRIWTLRPRLRRPALDSRDPCNISNVICARIINPKVGVFSVGLHTPGRQPGSAAEAAPNAGQQALLSTRLPAPASRKRHLNLNLSEWISFLHCSGLAV